MTYERLAVTAADSVYGRQEVNHARVIWSGAVDNVQFDVMRHENLHCVVVAFAGSNELADWGRHLFVRRRRIAGIGGLVHRGWLSDWRLARPTCYAAIFDTLQPTDTLIITGHSYGGALAQLAAVHFARLVSSKGIKIYTFGCPRVGNKKFANQLDALISHHYRYTVRRDPVPHLPLGIRYKHAGNHIQLPYRKNPHSIQSYEELLS